MIKTGIVVEATKSYAYIMTCDSEFFKLQIKDKKIPDIGEIYTSNPYKKEKFLYKLLLLLVTILLILYGLTNIITKITPTYSVVVDINASLQIKVNKYNEILDIEPINKNGSNLIKGMNLNHKTLDIALTMLLEKADKLKYLQEFYSRQDKPISIYITDHNNTSISLTSFKNKADKLKVIIQINDNGK